MPLKSYLITTGTIFGLFAATHIVELVSEWGSMMARPWFMAGIVAIVVVSGGLCIWAFRLLKAAGTSA
jgi:hypothetical protein